MSNTQVLRTETLHLIRDGMLKELIDKEIKRVYDDIASRPRLLKSRKVVITLSFDPKEEDLTNIEFGVQAKIPEQTFGRQMRMLKTNSGQQGFGFETDTENPHLINPDQTVIKEMDDQNQS